MSSHLQLYLDRAFAIGCDSALEMHAADVLPVANDGYTMIFCPAPERIRISGLRFAFRMSHCARSQARLSRADRYLPLLKAAPARYRERDERPPF